MQKQEDVLDGLLQTLEKSAAPQTVLQGLLILQKLGSNIIESPDNSKFRTVKRTNQAIKGKLLALEGAETIMSLLGFEEKGEELTLGDAELDKLVRGLPLIIFRRRLVQARMEGPEAYEEQLQIINRQKINSRKQTEQALSKQALEKTLEYDRQQRLKMEISYAKSRPLGLADKKPQGFIFYITKSQDYENKVLKSPVPVIIDFYADWCGPCKMLLPIMQAQVKADAGKWHLYKVNTDKKENAALSHKFKISGIPHLVVVKNGKVLYSQSGGMSANDFRLFVEEYITGS